MYDFSISALSDFSISALSDFSISAAESDVSTFMGPGQLCHPKDSALQSPCQPDQVTK